MDAQNKQPFNFSLGLALVFLTIMLLIAQLSGFIAFHFQFIATGTLLQQQTAIPPSVWPEIGFYFAAHMALWGLFILLVWATTRLIGLLFKLPELTVLHLGLLLWVIAVVAVYLANQIYFPLSIFSQLSSRLFPDAFAHELLIFIGLLLITALILALVSSLRYLNLKRAGFLSGLILFVAATYATMHLNYGTSTASIDKPNVIIIGVDSLTPDLIGVEENGVALTPTLERLLAKTTQFTSAYSTLPRTFPAWVSILTGQFPAENGARYDLIDPNKLRLDNTLPKLLQNAGYHTLYATDDSRFSYIDQKFGFDEVIGTKYGFNDFLLGYLTDFPLTNLVANSFIGKYLFYYNYGNRGAHITYQPMSFSKMLRAAIQKTQQRPLFFAVHFSLPHWPYAWSTTKRDEFPPQSSEDRLALFKKSVAATDAQVAELIRDLKQAGLLENTLLVLLSDHGEAFGLPGDRITQLANYRGNSAVSDSPLVKLLDLENPEASKQTIGHATDVLSLKQNQIMLAFGSYGENKLLKAHIDFPVSLVDIKPTVLDLLALQAPSSTGISLAPYIRGKSSTAPETRPLFMETGFTPYAIKTVHPEIKDLLEVGFQYFRIEPGSNRLVIKENMGKLIFKSKQRAVLYGDWIMALYPTTDKFIPVIVNIKTGEWSDILDSDFAKASPAAKMHDLLKSHYAGEL